MSRPSCPSCPAGASVRKAQGVLSGILGLAVRDRRLAVNPALGVALPPMQEKRRRYLTAGRLEALADAAGPDRITVLVLGYCRLRWSELAALRVRHVDLLRRRVLVEEAVTTDLFDDDLDVADRLDTLRPTSRGRIADSSRTEAPSEGDPQVRPVRRGESNP